jgi:hypothetical protein
MGAHGLNTHNYSCSDPHAIHKPSGQTIYNRTRPVIKIHECLGVDTPLYCPDSTYPWLSRCGYRWLRSVDDVVAAAVAEVQAQVPVAGSSSRAPPIFSACDTTVLLCHRPVYSAGSGGSPSSSSSSSYDHRVYIHMLVTRWDVMARNASLGPCGRATERWNGGIFVGIPPDSQSQRPMAVAKHAMCVTVGLPQPRAPPRRVRCAPRRRAGRRRAAPRASELNRAFSPHCAAPPRCPKC